MRKPTKVALESIAQKMVDGDLYINTRGTERFILEALRLHSETESTVWPNTIKEYQTELEEMCQKKMLEKYPLKKHTIIPTQFDDDVPGDSKIGEDDEHFDLYDEHGFQVDDHMILEKAMSIIKSMMSLNVDTYCSSDDKIFDEIANELNGEKPKKSSVKDYSMFFEGEDGLRVKRGEYKGLYVHEIDAQRWSGCAVGWSRYQLKENDRLGDDRPGALTEDDKNVFLDIISGKSV